MNSLELCPIASPCDYHTALKLNRTRHPVTHCYKISRKTESILAYSVSYSNVNLFIVVESVDERSSVEVLFQSPPIKRIPDGDIQLEWRRLLYFRVWDCTHPSSLDRVRQLTRTTEPTPPQIVFLSCVWPSLTVGSCGSVSVQGREVPSSQTTSTDVNLIPL